MLYCPDMHPYLGRRFSQTMLHYNYMYSSQTYSYMLLGFYREYLGTRRHLKKKIICLQTYKLKKQQISKQAIMKGKASTQRCEQASKQERKQASKKENNKNVFSKHAKQSKQGDKQASTQTSNSSKQCKQASQQASNHISILECFRHNREILQEIVQICTSKTIENNRICIKLQKFVCKL